MGTNNSVDIAMQYGVDGRGIGFRYPERVRDISYPMGTLGSCFRGKEAGA